MERRGSPDLVEQREHAAGVSLDQVQAALVVLVPDEGPLQPLGHVLLLYQEPIRYRYTSNQSNQIKKETPSLIKSFTG